MKISIIIILLSLFTSDLLLAQYVTELPVPISGRKRKAKMSNNGEIVIVGRNLDGYPTVTKMDTAGSVIWQKHYDDSSIIRYGPFGTFTEVRFDNIVFDDGGNMYLLTEIEADPLKPFIVKLDPAGELIWVSEELRGVGNTYEHDFDSWMFAGETKLTVVTGYSITMNVDLSTGEYLGIDPVLSNHYMNVSAPEMVYDGKHYRKTTDGFLIFDSYGNYTFEPDEAYIPFNVWHVDDFGYYADTAFNANLLNPNSIGIVPQINKINFNGEVEESLLCTLNGNYDINAEKNTVGITVARVHPSKGIIVCGFLHDYKPAGGWGYKSWVAQIREDDFEIVYDTTTLVRATYPGEMMFFDNTVFIHFGDRWNRTRTKLLKLNLKDVQVSSPEKEIPEEKRAKVYPNPSNTGEFIIQAEGEIQQVEIFTTAGRLIYSTRSKNLRQTVQLNAKGIYILRVKTSDGRIENHKIVSH